MAPGAHGIGIRGVGGRGLRGAAASVLVASQASRPGRVLVAHRQSRRATGARPGTCWLGRGGGAGSRLRRGGRWTGSGRLGRGGRRRGRGLGRSRRGATAGRRHQYQDEHSGYHPPNLPVHLFHLLAYPNTWLSYYHEESARNRRKGYVFLPVPIERGVAPTTSHHASQLLPRSRTYFRALMDALSTSLVKSGL